MEITAWYIPNLLYRYHNYTCQELINYTNNTNVCDFGPIHFSSTFLASHNRLRDIATVFIIIQLNLK